MNISNQSCVNLFWWSGEIIPLIGVHIRFRKNWVIVRRILFNYSNDFNKLSQTLRFIARCIRKESFWRELCSIIVMNWRSYGRQWDLWHIALGMNDSYQRSVQLFRWIEEMMPHIGIHSTLRKRWMMLIRVVFRYFAELKKLSHTSSFIERYIGIEWFWIQFYIAILNVLKY